MTSRSWPEHGPAGFLPAGLLRAFATTMNLVISSTRWGSPRPPFTHAHELLPH